MSQERRKRRKKERNKDMAGKRETTKKDKLYFIMVFSGIFILVLVLYFLDAILYFFYLISH